jgi:HEAT repeat protein
MITTIRSGWDWLRTLFKGRLLRLAGLVLFAAVVATLCLSVLLGPFHEGHRLSYWVRELNCDDTARSEIAAQALRRIGTNALPSLVAMIGQRESPMTELPREFSTELSEMGLPVPRPSETQVNAVNAFRVLGPGARPAIPALLQLANQETSVWAAALALIHIGPEGPRVLYQALTNESRMVRLEILTQVDPVNIPARTAASTLVRCLADVDPEVRTMAAIQLGRLGRLPEVGVPALAKLMTDDVPDCRSSAARALAGFGLGAARAESHLTEALDDADAEVRQAASYTLKRLRMLASAKAPQD